MAGKASTKNTNNADSVEHEFHLVDPSPWPIVMSFALLAMTAGGVRYMHDLPYGGWIALGGVGVLLYTMYTWWRDVVREGIIDKAHTRPVKSGLRFGMGLFIVSEIMFFVAFFWAFFGAALFPKIALEAGEIWPVLEGAIWPPAGIVTFDPFDLPLMNTIILLLSGTTVTWAHHAVQHGDNKGVIQGLTYTVILGVLFTCLQAFEYSHAAFALTDGKYPSVFYLATGFHGFHVIVGTIFLFVCLMRARKNQFTETNHLGLEFAAWYWHFVDVVWLFLFVAVYIWGS